MKFARVGPVGAERPAILDHAGCYRDIDELRAPRGGTLTSNGKLSGKIALVTGAAQGIGAAIAKAAGSGSRPQ